MQTFGLQWDSTSPLPFTPPLQAKYVNGRFAQRVQYKRGLVWIDVFGNAPNAARWLDVEAGAGAVDRVPGWLDERAHHLGGPDGGIYCNRNTLQAVEQAAGDRPHDLWVATLDGTLDFQLPDGRGRLVLIQVFPEQMLGFHADGSVVVDPAYWDDHALTAAHLAAVEVNGVAA